MGDLWSRMKTWFIFHLLFAVIFLVSGCIISVIMFIVMITVWPFNQTLYRKIVVHLAYTVWCQFTVLGQWWSGSDCCIYLDKPEDYDKIGKEHSIVIMNHKYDIDWLMAWIISERLGMLGGTKIYGKSSLRFVPVIGWLWIFTESIFLKRQWDKDKSIIKRDLQGLCSYPDDYWVTLLLFPEGTRFTEDKHRESMEVAKQKGMPLLKHHLLPRSKGFVQSMTAVRGKFHAIWNLTVAFSPEKAQPTLMNILLGRAVLGHMHASRIPLSEVPEGDEECAEWLQQLFREKDEIYDDFVRNGKYTRGQKFEVPWRYRDLLTHVFWLLILGIPFLYSLFLLFTSGAYFWQAMFLGFLALASLGVRQMIAVTETEKGSKYGKQTKAGKKD